MPAAAFVRALLMMKSAAPYFLVRRVVFLLAFLLVVFFLAVFLGMFAFSLVPARGLSLLIL